jgi:hypothetical protein
MATLVLVPAAGEPLGWLASFLAGLLAHALMLSLVIEAMIKRIGKAWLLIPVGAYGGYYAILGYQVVSVDRKLAELRFSNPGQVMTFDPARYSLVSKDAEYLISNYKIPVAYSVDEGQYSENKGFSSYRLIGKDKRCDAPVNHLHAVSVPLNSENVMSKKACLIRMSEALQSKALTVISKGGGTAWDTGWGFREGVTEIVLDNKIVGSYRTASMWQWSSLPFIILGCRYGGVPSRPQGCHVEVFGHTVYVSGVSVETRYDRRALPEAIMLGLPKYTVADVTTFEGSDQTFDFLARLGKSN